MLVLTGAGDKAFCAGGDLKEMADDRACGVPPADFLPYLQRTVQTDKPVIAAVNGVAFAGGFLLAQMCDLVIAADHARFAITEAKVGPRVAVGGAAAVADPAARRDGAAGHGRADHARSAPTRSGSSTRSCRPRSCATPPRAMAGRIAANAPLSVARGQAARLPGGRAGLGRRRSTRRTRSTSPSTSARTRRRDRARSGRSAPPAGRAADGGSAGGVELGAQLGAPDLAADGLRQLVDEVDLARVLVRRGQLPACAPAAPRPARPRPRSRGRG